MFGNLNKPLSAYKAVGVDTAITMADPHQLILLLFEGAKVAIIEARTQMEQGHVAEKGMLISKAIDIIGNGLQAALDKEKGGELAANLDALYDYMTNRLLYANLKNDPAALSETAKLLGELHGAWAEIRPQVVAGQKAA